VLPKFSLLSLRHSEINFCLLLSFKSFDFVIFPKEIPDIPDVLILRIIILPVVLHRCETWSLTSREEHKFKRD
jgi:hypothetical protein